MLVGGQVALERLLGEQLPGDRPVLTAGEQNLRQRTLRGLVAVDPPDSGVVAGPRERDVEQSEFLGRLFRPGQLDLGLQRPAGLAGSAHVEDAPAGRGVVVVDVPAHAHPHVRTQHHRELEALGHPYRHDLDGLGVGLDPPRRHIGVAVGVHLHLHTPAEPSEGTEQTRGTHRGVAHGHPEQLTEVFQVGDGAVAVGMCEESLDHPGVLPDSPQELHDAPRAEDGAPRDELLLESADVGLARAREPFGGHATEPGSGECAGPLLVRWPHEGFEQPGELVGCRALHHARTTGQHRWYPAGHEGCLHLLGRVVGSDQHRDVPGFEPTGRTAPRGGTVVGQDTCVEQFDRTGHQVRRDGLVRRRRGDGGRVVEQQRRGRRADVQTGHGLVAVPIAAKALPLVALGHLHGGELDGVPEPCAFEQDRGRLEHRFIGAPIGTQGALLDPRCRLDGRDVGGHVRSAEGVDGLLGVADQHQRGCVVDSVGAHRSVSTRSEERAEDLPLDRIGVLELVDEHGTEATAQDGPGGRTRLFGCQGVAQSNEEVVEALGTRVAAPGCHGLHRTSHE